jgi:magnesium chelatase family protein
MGVARIASRGQVGLAAPLVHVEVHLSAGLPNFSIVGLPATAVKESKERVRAALANCGFELPAGRITVNLAPADLPKEGGRFDLPIALGILIASGQAPSPQELERTEFYGELGLAGEVKPVRGLLLAAAHALSARHRVVVPWGNLQEVAVVASGKVHGAHDLIELCAALRGEGELAIPLEAPAPGAARSTSLDLSDVRGQWRAKRALEIAAAGAHSLLMIGPPGAGKSMLAQRLPGVLPPLSHAEALEVTTVESLSGVVFDPQTFGRRPYRAPHHTASSQAIVGGGPQARPGEVSLAHHGVLFLDELPEFDRRVLEALREPLETGTITVSRAALLAEYPAQFQLVAAMNPCPCGYDGDGTGRCQCFAPAIARYRGRVSGPLLDRIDLRIEVPAVDAKDLAASSPPGEASAAVAARVTEARDRQRTRSGKLSSQLSVPELGRYCRLDCDGERLLWHGRAALRLSARGFHRVLRVSRTIADLAGADTIGAPHVAEALQLKRAFDEDAPQPARNVVAGA